MDPTRRTYESKRGVAQYDTRALRGGEAHLIETYLAGKHVLDLGCGTGRTTAHIKRVAEVIGVDYSQAMIARAKELEPELAFRVMDACSLDFPDASFDAVFFSFNGFDMLYPFANRVRALREARRVLTLGGIFAYTSKTGGVPPFNNPRRIVSHLYTWVRGYRRPYFAHFTGYGFLVTCHLDPEVQKGMLREEGFRLLEALSTRPGEVMYIAKKA